MTVAAYFADIGKKVRGGAITLLVFCVFVVKLIKNKAIGPLPGAFEV